MKVSADVWLLTEIPEDAVPDGYLPYWSSAPLVAGRHFAAVLVRDTARVIARWDGDLHPASAAAVVGGTVFCSSVLPWRSCGREAPWEGATTADKTAAVTRRLADSLPRGATVWGGDWNHAFRGPERAGSVEGREHVLEACAKLDLTVVTADSPHRTEGLFQHRPRRRPRVGDGAHGAPRRDEGRPAAPVGPRRLRRRRPARRDPPHPALSLHADAGEPSTRRREASLRRRPVGGG